MRSTAGLTQSAHSGRRDVVRQAVSARRAIRDGRIRQPHASSSSSSSATFLSSKSPMAEPTSFDKVRRMHIRSDAVKRSSLYANSQSVDRLSTMCAMQADISNLHAPDYIPDPIDILAEWKSLNRRLAQRVGKGKERRLDDEQDESNVSFAKQAETDTPLPPAIESDFFTSQTFASPSSSTLNEITLQHPQASTADTASVSTQSITMDRSESILRPSRSRRANIWSATVDQSLMRKAVLSRIDAIRSGKIDLLTLSREALDDIERATSHARSKESERAMRLEELQSLLMTFWLEILHRSIAKNAGSPNVLEALVQLTRSLYLSTLQENAEREGVSDSFGLLIVQRATLHRLFAILHDVAIAQEAIPSSVRESCLVTCATILRDERLRGSQARYVTRKFLSTLSHADDRHDPCIGSQELWHEMTQSISHLVKTGTIPLNSSPASSGTTRRNSLSGFMLLCGKIVGEGRAPQGLMESKMIQIAKETAKLRRRSGRALGSQSIQSSFVGNENELESIIYNLSRRKQYGAARTLLSLAPTSLNTFRAKCYLMKHWSRTPLLLSRSDASQDTTSAERCDYSREILWDAVKQIDMSKLEPACRQLRLLASSRFTSHADRCNAAVLLKDLDELARFWPKKEGIQGRFDMLEQLGERAQVQAIRALCRSGCFGHASQWAARLARGGCPTAQRIGKGDVKVASRSFGSRLLNVLLHSTFSTQRNLSSSNTVVRTLLSRSSRNRRIGRVSTSAYHFRLSASSSATSRVAKLQQGIAFVRRFYARTGVLPDEDAVYLFIRQIARCRGAFISRKARRELYRRLEWDCNTNRGVKNILADLDTMKTQTTVRHYLRRTDLPSTTRKRHQIVRNFFTRRSKTVGVLDV